VRYAVLAVLCSLGFLTYLDRICISRVQDSLARDLGFDQLDDDALEKLRAGESNGYKDILKPEDYRKLEKEVHQEDSGARRRLSIARLQTEKKNDCMRWVFTAFMIGYMLFEVPGGWLGDRWGSRIVILRIVLWWSMFTALTGSVDTIVKWFFGSSELGLVLGTMVLIRFLFGVGEAGAYPNIGRTLARWFPFRDRAFAMGTIWMASRFGGAFAPLIIGYLMTSLGGWREAFWTLGVIGGVWATAFFLWFRNRPEEKPTVNAEEVAIIRSAEAGSGSVYDDHHHGGLSWRRLFFGTNLWAIYITAAAVSFSWYINVTYLPRYLNDRFDVGWDDPKMEWMSFMPLFVSAFFCCAGGAWSDRLVRRLGRRWGRSLLGVTGFGIAGVCDFLIPWMDDPWQVIGLICAACAVQDLALAGLWAVGADIGGRYSGTVLGTMNMMGGIGAILSPVLTPLLAKVYDWDTAFVVFASSYLLGSLLWLRIDATEQIVKSAASEGSA
jgi:MFS transporter, ACS family, glucarate transporter